jgi:hypothetical protein
MSQQCNNSVRSYPVPVPLPTGAELPSHGAITTHMKEHAHTHTHTHTHTHMSHKSTFVTAVTRSRSRFPPVLGFRPMVRSVDSTHQANHCHVQPRKRMCFCCRVTESDHYVMCRSIPTPPAQKFGRPNLGTEQIVLWVHWLYDRWRMRGTRATLEK